MALRLEDKKKVAEEVASIASTAISAVAADYRGITVTEMTQLRVKARAMGIRVKVVRNRLAMRGMDGTDFECLKAVLKGPTIIAFSDKEPSAPAKLARDFRKTCEKLEVKALALNGRLYEAKDLQTIASLPTRDEAIAQLMSVMKAPIVKLVRTIAEPHSKLVRVLDAIRAKKEGAS